MSRVEQAVQDCITRLSPDAVAYLRSLIQDVLVERLTILSIDAAAIQDAVDETFRLFASAVRPERAINWLAWIVGTALSLIVEDVVPPPWFSDMSDSVVGGSLRERRALVFGALLTLDSPCQWLLLRSICDAKLEGHSRECQRQLKGRLNSVA
jgi:hypothetical protein